MKKKIGVISVLVLCLTFVSIMYLKKDKKSDEKVDDVYYKSVVFKGKIPGSFLPFFLVFRWQQRGWEFRKAPGCEEGLWLWSY